MTIIKDIDPQNVTADNVRTDNRVISLNTISDLHNDKGVESWWQEQMSYEL